MFGAVKEFGAVTEITGTIGTNPARRAHREGGLEPPDGVAESVRSAEGVVVSTIMPGT
jgi:hypothetical protein